MVYILKTVLSSSIVLMDMFVSIWGKYRGSLERISYLLEINKLKAMKNTRKGSSYTMYISQNKYTKSMLNLLEKECNSIIFYYY